MTAPAAPAAATSSAAARVEAGRRVDALDGVRALAVTTVLIVHALPASGFPGYVGVDVFFVLSGYLITTLLLAERDRHGSVALPLFWARRFLRLAPALAVFLVALYPLGEALVGADYVSRALTVMEFRGNLALTVERTSIAPLDHAWSLGQEAQFYLLWPPLLLLLVAVLRLPRRAVQVLLLVATAWVFRQLWLVQEADVRPTDDFRLDVRAGGLLLGCALALALRGRARLLALPGLAEGALAGMILVLVAVTCGLDRDLQHVVPVAVVLAALLVGALLAGPAGPAARLLSHPGPVFVGRISYSLYLWHYPFFLAFGKRDDLALPVVLLLEVTLSVAAAAISYTAIERPVARYSARRLHR